MKEKNDAFKGVQKEKVAETLEMIFAFYHTKEKFMKGHFPIQEILMKNVQKTAQITLDSLKILSQTIKEEKDSIASLYQHQEKAMLNHEAKFKISESKVKTQSVNPSDWNKNIVRVLQGMSSAHRQKIAHLKAYFKILQTSYNEIVKEENRYRGELKNSFKQFNKQFSEMDGHEKEQTKILTKITKQSKSKEPKDSVFFLTEVKRLQHELVMELTSFVNRNKLILDFVKGVVKNEKSVCKKIKDNLNAYLSKKKHIFRENEEGEKLWGLLAVVEDNVQQSRERYLQKTLITKQMIEVFTGMLPPQKSKIHHMIKYLSLGLDSFEDKLQMKKSVQIFGSNLSFKTFSQVSLAQGWLITSYTKAFAYLTYDHFLVIFDIKGQMLKKIQTKASKISKVDDGNIVFLEEVIKGFFKDSKEEYKIKFDDGDRMEEFILYMENNVV